MKIPQKIMSACVADFKQWGTVTVPLLMRRHRIDAEMAKEIIELISIRYPNLWRDREANRQKKWIEGMKP